MTTAAPTAGKVDPTLLPSNGPRIESPGIPGRRDSMAGDARSAQPSRSEPRPTSSALRQLPLTDRLGVCDCIGPQHRRGLHASTLILALRIYTCAIGVVRAFIRRRRRHRARSLIRTRKTVLHYQVPSGQLRVRLRRFLFCWRRRNVCVRTNGPAMFFVSFCLIILLRVYDGE